MNEEELQGHPSDSLSEDDIASALGFATTLSEPLLPQDEMDTAEDEGLETADESGATESGATETDAVEDPKKHEDDQDKEIADIRAQLEQLLSEEETKDGEKESDTEATG